MQATFTDLVGTIVVPAHCFNTTELTDLTPALDAAASIQENRDASGAAYTSDLCVPLNGMKSTTEE